MAGKALTERQAKLYSQRLRYDMGRDGLSSFLSSDVDIYLDEAMLLVQCGLLERNADPNSGWRDGIKRAAEILEWLSQSSLKPADAPLHLIAAAAYQLSDYPAMALGHLRRVPGDQPFSVVLRELLRGNFSATLEAIHKFWRVRHSLSGAGEPGEITTQTFQHMLMCIGTICFYLRTGIDSNRERALVKLEQLAAGLIHSRDSYSYLLAVLTAASCRRFVETSIWQQIGQLQTGTSESVREALAQFARSAFINKRTLVWPAQIVGIERLRENSSFVLCTPTGSGKTTVATIAVVQALFSDFDNAPGFHAPLVGNLVLYLVPSRALAAEVEGRFAQDLKGVAADPIVVTGLYGGIDWGPTDAWIQTDNATIVICTFEKADALLRYLGVLFLDRVRLVVIDEVHMVEQDESRLLGLEDGSSRAFRLEQLGARLFRARNDHGFRVLALSAVAARAAPALARWIGTTQNSTPTMSAYRSTRQMLGSLQVSTSGQYTIRYDLMDGQSLKFDDERRSDTPYVRSPFPQLPNGIAPGLGPEVSMRAPTLWAALQLAAERPDGSTPSVLISLTQNIEPFAATCADLMDTWSSESLPNFWSVDETNELWVRCLASAADYFTTQSVEYRLLRRGIAVHHGKMPGLLARRLKTVIDQGFVRVIIATSTLSEGVNIPVSFLLVPSVFRGQGRLSLQEFSNLIGRVGRPGVATEGSALVVLPERTDRRPSPSRQWDGYDQLVGEIQKTTVATGVGTPEDSGSSPLAHLLEALERAWKDLTGGSTSEEFIHWLEETAVIDAPDEAGQAHRYLDSLDAFLIAAIQEVEELRDAELTASQIETELISVWRRTYAFAAANNEGRLSEIWLTRGRVIKNQYSDSAQRRQIYKTSLSPRSATKLLGIENAVRSALVEGANYANWQAEERFTFVRNILALLCDVPSFKFSTKLGRRNNFDDWPRLLRWWLVKDTLTTQPTPKEITNWYDFVAQNFIYRSVWGLGSIIGLLLDNPSDELPIRALEIGDWPRTGLPWIAFWIKELITWGTHDPVAAFLLARGNALNRPEAEADAQSYYGTLDPNISPNDRLDPRLIREWVGARRSPRKTPTETGEVETSARLVRAPTEYRDLRVSVLPIEVENGFVWVDPAGYEVARTETILQWSENPMDFDFHLDVARGRLVGTPYRPYQR